MFGGPRIEGGPSLHPDTVQRICCDSGAALIAHHEAGKPGTSMDVGRRTRVIPAALRRALCLRDHGCRFPGCTQTRFVDAHHVQRWSRRGPTTLANLILACRHHHRLLHEGGYRLQASGDGSFHFFRPDGRPIPEIPDPIGGTVATLPEHHAARISHRTAVPDWHGDRLDLDYAVDVLTRSRAGLN